MQTKHKTQTPPRPVVAGHKSAVNTRERYARMLEAPPLRKTVARANLIAALVAASDAAWAFAATENDVSQRLRWNEEGERLRETAAELDAVALSRIMPGVVNARR